MDRKWPELLREMDCTAGRAAFLLDLAADRMHEEASSSSAVCSATYSTEPSSRRILDSHTQNHIRLPNFSLAVIVPTPAWFAATLSQDSGVKQPAVASMRRSYSTYLRHLLGTLVPS